MKFHIASMTCGGCVRAVTAAIKEIDPAASVEIDLATHTVLVESSQPSLVFEGALLDAGFPPVLQPS